MSVEDKGREGLNDNVRDHCLIEGTVPGAAESHHNSDAKRKSLSFIRGAMHK